MVSKPSISRQVKPLGPEHGSALVLAVMATLLMTTLGSALLLICITETRISAHYRVGGEALQAADAAIERAIVDLFALSDWNSALSGSAPSGFRDGPPGGTRQLPGRTIDLTALTSTLRCGRASPCSDADTGMFTAERPWGINNPRWELYAWGPIRQVTSAITGEPHTYVVVWIGDDQDDIDGDPLHDGVMPDNPGSGVVALVAHAYGPEHVRRVVAATIARGPAGAAPDSSDDSSTPAQPPRPRIVSWREVR